jgi:hypothetical protein
MSKDPGLVPCKAERNFAVHVFKSHISIALSQIAHSTHHYSLTHHFLCQHRQDVEDFFQGALGAQDAFQKIPGQLNRKNGN